MGAVTLFAQRGGTDAQRVRRGTLAGVVAPAWHAGRPALLVVGVVAAQRETRQLVS